MMSGAIALAAASKGNKVAWIAPTYKQSRPLWRWVERTAGGVSEVSRSERTVSFKHGFLGIYSADNADSMRGESFNLVIVDEASRINEEAWTDVIQPTLADFAGDAILISTPRGKNWFWREWARADGRRVAAFRAPTNANPSPNIQAAYELAKSSVPDRTFRQEWNAEFVDDGGGVFRGVRSVATSVAGDANEAHTIVAGVDWSGGGADYTVVTVFDATEKREIHKERFSGLDWGMNEARVEAVLRRFNVMVALGEDNGMGGPLNNNLRRKGLRVRDFHTSHETKAEIIEGLVIAFERGDIHILPDETTINELESFETSRLPSGSVRYAAPDGMHDDTVMSMALAWRAVNGSKGFSFG
jgi:hypothetical protein